MCWWARVYETGGGSGVDAQYFVLVMYNNNNNESNRSTVAAAAAAAVAEWRVAAEGNAVSVAVSEP